MSRHRQRAVDMNHKVQDSVRLPSRGEMDMGFGTQSSSGLSSVAAVPIVFVIDADPSIREAISQLICSAGWRPRMFASAEEFLEQPKSPGPSCLVLDVSLPGLGGLELQELLAERREMPVI